MQKFNAIPDFPKYEVGNNGDIRNIKSGRLLVKKINRYGYEIVNLQLDGEPQKTVSVHRIVASVFIENPHGYPTVNHKDGNKKNNTVSNLEWCTVRENLIHAISTGLKRSWHGCVPYNSKIPSERIGDIRAMLKSGVAVKDIAAMFDVNTSSIYKIKNGISWKNFS